MRFAIAGLLALALAIPAAMSFPRPAHADSESISMCHTGDYLVAVEATVSPPTTLQAEIYSIKPYCAPWPAGAARMGDTYGLAVYGGLNFSDGRSTVVSCPATGVVQGLRYSTTGLANWGGGTLVQKVALSCAAPAAPQTIIGRPANMGEPTVGDSVQVLTSACGPGQLANGLAVTVVDGETFGGKAVSWVAGLRVLCPLKSIVGSVADAYPRAGQPIHARGAAAMLAATKVAGSDTIGGHWYTDQGDMDLTQAGNHLNGRYGADGGGLSLDRTGGGWSGYWAERSSGKRCPTAQLDSYYWGRADLTFSDQNRHFAGKWSYCDAPAENGAAWTGDKLP